MFGGVQVTPTLDILYIESALRKLTAQVPTMDSRTVVCLRDELSGLLDELEETITARLQELDRQAVCR